jgi:hypothetical protein
LPPTRSCAPTIPALQARWGGGSAVETLRRAAQRQGQLPLMAQTTDTVAAARPASPRSTWRRKPASSQSTVSRALAGDTSISEPTRQRVIAAAARLNYQVNRNAARLRRGKTGTLASA